MVLKVGKRVRAVYLALILGILGTVVSSIATPSAFAQVTTADLKGTVLDPSGALIPKAKIVLTGQATASRAAPSAMAAVISPFPPFPRATTA